MKKRILYVLLIIFIAYCSFSQNWSLLDSTIENRYSATAIVINNKAYYGLGFKKGDKCSKDWWQFDQKNNSWIRKADFPEERHSMTGFAIGDKAYLSWGNKGNGYIEYTIYEYNSSTDLWKVIGVSPFLGDDYRTAFSINGKGYYVFGRQGTCDGSVPYSDHQVWEFNPSNYTWTLKNKFPGKSGCGATAEVINGKAYLYLGAERDVEGPTSYLKDLWEYTPGTDTWIKKEDYPGEDRNFANMFKLGKYLYLGQGEKVFYDAYGCSWNEPLRDFWRYDTKTNIWEKSDSIQALSRNYSSSFCINHCAYVAGGLHTENDCSTGMTFTITNQLLEYCIVPSADESISETIEPINITLFPNPTKGNLTLRCDDRNGKFCVSATNQLGQVIWTKQYPEKTAQHEILSFVNEPPGIYFIEISSDDQREVRKIIVE